MRLGNWGLAALGVLGAAGLAFGVIVLGGAAQAQGGPIDQTRYQEILAAKLGISVAQLEAAQKAAREQAIDEAVTAGQITAEQAERLKNFEPGQLRDKLAARGFAHGAAVRGVGNVIQIAAETLGVTPMELLQELREKTLAEAASDHGISRDQLKATILSKTQAELNTKVSNGDLTREQADRVYEALNNNIDRVLDGGPLGGRFGPRLR